MTQRHPLDREAVIDALKLGWSTQQIAAVLERPQDQIDDIAFVEGFRRYLGPTERAEMLVYQKTKRLLGQRTARQSLVDVRRGA